MTLAELLLAALLRAQAAGGLAVLLVLALRGPARRLIGAELSYRLWAAVPAVAVVALFPSLGEFFKSYGTGAFVPIGLPAALLLQVWLIGAVAAGALIAFSEARFRRLARKGAAGPAVMGVFWPRMITPADYAARFTAPERELIRQHERTHVARRDPRANLLIAVLQALSWFNPLVHVAAACARLDQELACDAAVVEARPGCRRLYAATLIKAHLAAPRSPLACAWPAAGRHPLETRLSMLARRPLSLAQYLRGAVAVGGVAMIAALCVWSIAPRWDNAPSFAWPPVQSTR